MAGWTDREMAGGGSRSFRLHRLGRNAQQTPRLAGHFLTAYFARSSQADDARHIERAAPHAALVPAAIHLADQPHPRPFAPHIQSANTFWTVQFVG